MTPTKSNTADTQPLYKITENLDDHTGYKGQPVFIHLRHEDGFYTVQDKDGNQWTCGIEELKEVHPPTPEPDFMDWWYKLPFEENMRLVGKHSKPMPSDEDIKFMYEAEHPTAAAAKEEDNGVIDWVAKEDTVSEDYLYNLAIKESELQFPLDDYRGKVKGVDDERTGQALRGACVGGFESGYKLAKSDLSFAMDLAHRENKMVEKLEGDNAALVSALKECREWYENNANKIAPETPICFSKALSVINSIEGNK